MKPSSMAGPGSRNRLRNGSTERDGEHGESRRSPPAGQQPSGRRDVRRTLRRSGGPVLDGQGRTRVHCRFCTRHRPWGKNRVRLDGSLARLVRPSGTARPDRGRRRAALTPRRRTP